MQPRIYTYKITFEEVPYYYYGSKKEKYYNQEYWGSPKTNKWCWELYTPKKQILELFDYTDDGYEECRKVENRLIKPVLNDPYCLNERCGGSYSTKILTNAGKKTAKIHKMNNTGFYSYSKNKFISFGKSGGKKAHKLGLGFHKLSKDQKKIIGERCRDMKIGIFSDSYTKKDKEEVGHKTGLYAYENKLGIFSLSEEEIIKIRRKSAEYAAEKLSKPFRLLSPSGEIEEGINISKFCRENDLDRGHISSVLNGKRKSHKGYKLP